MPIDCVGKHPGFGAYSARPRGSGPVWEEVKNHFALEPFVIQQMKLYNRSTPNLSTLYSSVCEYDRAYTTRPKNDNLLMEILDEARIKFAPKSPLPLLHINDMRQTDFPGSTSPCLPYTAMTNKRTGSNFKTKLEAWPQAKYDARKWSHFIKEGDKVHLPPSMVFARGKICTRDVVKTRAIWGKSFGVLIMQAIFFRNLWNYYLEGTSPCAYKYTAFHRGYRNLQVDLEKAGYSPRTGGQLLSIDFKKYDTSIPPWLIFAVYDIFAGYLDFSKYMHHGTPNPDKTRKLYWRLAKECVNTRFRMPDGYEFIKHGGVDSGSFDFQLIECVCTWVMINYALRKLGRRSLFCSVLGDDSITLVDDKGPVSLAQISSIIQETFGVVVSPEKSGITYDLAQCKFLGRYCRNGSPYRDTAEVILAALYPSRTDTCLLDVAERVIALYYDNANSNPCAIHFLKKVWMRILPELLKAGYTMSMHTWSNRWMKKFVMWGLRAPPELRIPDDWQVYLLVHTTVLKNKKNDTWSLLI